MGFGSNGAILRVDLTSGTTSVETFDEAFYRRYPGGKALAAYHLLRDMPAGADPLGPDNVLVLAAGLLTGAPVSTATRFNAIARSPLTGGFGESEAGGYWGPELKMAGFDAIILTGRSPRAGLDLGQGRRGGDPRRPRAVGPGPAHRPGGDQGRRPARSCAASSRSGAPGRTSSRTRC